MRIITGSARGARLTAPVGMETRPTAERVKEAVFSMLQFELEGRELLDGFAGSGQMGLEALSRGARHAVFVDTRREAIEAVRANAQKARLAERCTILQGDLLSYLRTARRSGRRFDLVFLDPPYDSDLAQGALDLLAREDLVREGGLVVIESGRAEPFSARGFTLRRHARYGRASVTLLRRAGDAAPLPGSAATEADNPAPRPEPPARAGTDDPADFAGIASENAAPASPSQDDFGRSVGDSPSRGRAVDRADSPAEEKPPAPGGVAAAAPARLAAPAGKSVSAAPREPFAGEARR